MLQAAALTIGYERRTVATGIDLGVQRGEVLCLLGPNGAGKTTLFKTLLGLIPALGGEVVIDGRPLGALTRSELARSMAYVPQAQVMEFAYTVLDLVLMGRTAHLGPFSAPVPNMQVSVREEADSPRVAAGTIIWREPRGAAAMPQLGGVAD